MNIGKLITSIRQIEESIDELGHLTYVTQDSYGQYPIMLIRS